MVRLAVGQAGDSVVGDAGDESGGELGHALGHGGFLVVNLGFGEGDRVVGLLVGRGFDEAIDLVVDLAFEEGDRVVDLSVGMRGSRTAETFTSPNRFCFLVLLLDTIDHEAFEDACKGAFEDAEEVLNEALDEAFEHVDKVADETFGKVILPTFLLISPLATALDLG